MLIGHQKQWQFLKKSFKLRRIPHGFLFQGQEGLGKKTFALEFIKLVNCRNNEISARPCQKCLSCQQIEKRTHPDFILVEPLKKDSNPPTTLPRQTRAPTIQISQIRDLGLRLSAKPYSASFKSTIIDQAHSMSPEAQSCFLKTLEEPKGKTILILITEYPERLLPTILSRVQKIKFYPVKKVEIRDYLISQGLSDKAAEELSLLSFGKPGRTLEFLLMPAKLENQKQKISDLIRICNSPLAFRFQYLKGLLLESKNLKEALEIWLRYFRNALIATINNQSFDGLRIDPERSRTGQQSTINQLGYSLSKLKNILQLIQNTIFYISATNVNPRLALEMLMLELSE
ncbi:hypothetical protein KJA16_02680 [Patescibacteria group bacterium]|nr:hypothetical protein [Patescibacteria group bacterium]